MLSGFRSSDQGTNLTAQHRRARPGPSLVSLLCAKVSANAAPVVGASGSDLLSAGPPARTAQQVGTGFALARSTLLVLRFRRRTPASEPSRRAQ